MSQLPEDKRRQKQDEEQPANAAVHERDKKLAMKKRMRRASLTLMDSVSDILEMHGSDKVGQKRSAQSGSSSDDSKESPMLTAAADSSRSSVPTHFDSGSEALITQFAIYLRDLPETERFELIKRNFLSADEMSSELLGPMDLESMVDTLLSFYLLRSRLSAEVPPGTSQMAMDRIKGHPSLGGALPTQGIDWCFVANLDRYLLGTALIAPSRVPAFDSIDESGSAALDTSTTEFGSKVSALSLDEALVSSTGDSSTSRMAAGVSVELPMSDVSSHERISTREALGELERELSMYEDSTTPTKKASAVKRSRRSMATDELDAIAKMASTPLSEEQQRAKFVKESLQAVEGLFKHKIQPSVEESLAATSSMQEKTRDSKMAKYQSRRTLLTDERPDAVVAEGYDVVDSGHVDGRTLLTEWRKTADKLQEIVFQLDDFQEDVMEEVTEINDNMKLTAGISGKTLDTVMDMLDTQKKRYEEEILRIGQEVARGIRVKRSGSESSTESYEESMAKMAKRGRTSSIPNVALELKKATFTPSAGSTPTRQPLAVEVPTLPPMSTTKKKSATPGPPSFSMLGVTRDRRKHTHKRSSTLSEVTATMSHFKDFTACFDARAVPVAEGVENDDEEEEVVDVMTGLKLATTELKEAVERSDSGRMLMRTDTSASVKSAGARLSLASDLNSNMKRLLAAIQVQIGSQAAEETTLLLERDRTVMRPYDSGSEGASEFEEGDAECEELRRMRNATYDLKAKVAELERQCKHNETLIRDKDLLIGQFQEELSKREETRTEVAGIRSEIKAEIQSCIAAAVSTRRTSSVFGFMHNQTSLLASEDWAVAAASHMTEAGDSDKEDVDATPGSRRDLKHRLESKGKIPDAQLKKYQENQRLILKKLTDFGAKLELLPAAVASSSTDSTSLTTTPVISSTLPLRRDSRSELRALVDLTSKLTGDISAVSTVSVLREELHRLKGEKERAEMQATESRDKSVALTKRVLELEEENSYLRRSKIETVKHMVDEIEDLREKFRGLRKP